MTNAENIRKMSDVELAKFLVMVSNGYIKPSIHFCKSCYSHNCTNCYLDFLQKPVKAVM